MKLVERETNLEMILEKYCAASKGAGNTLFLAGEGGIGKTSLVNLFLEQVGKSSSVFVGNCDSLFTPRPLGPLFDIAAQIGGHFVSILKNEKDKSLIFTLLLQELLIKSSKVTVLVIEDIHWADEATVDLVKFMARRVQRFKCLLIVTYRDDEVNIEHPMNSIFGEVNPEVYSKIVLHRLSLETVDKLAKERGHLSGEKIYELTGGNPFYVSEILASYSLGIPEKIKDSILSIFRSADPKSRAAWELLSILPAGMEQNLIKEVNSDFPNDVTRCVDRGVIINVQDRYTFKHELFRLAIEESLEPLKRKNLHRAVLKVLLANQNHSGVSSQLVHHAKLAEETSLVREFAPQAAEQAALVGSHLAASKLYQTAIEHTQEDHASLVLLHKHHAYEAYMAGQIDAAISSQQFVVEFYRKQNLALECGDALRFLSWQWWLKGEKKKAMQFALEAIERLGSYHESKQMALALSNLSVLYLDEGDMVSGLVIGNKAVTLSELIGDQEALSHSLGNLGSILLKLPGKEIEGEQAIRKSISIAIENRFHDNVVRGYANLLSSFVVIKKYEKAELVFKEGFAFCENCDLRFKQHFLQFWNARRLFGVGRWDEATREATPLQNSFFSLAKSGVLTLLAQIKMRQGDFQSARLFLSEAKSIVVPTQEISRIVPVYVAELELQWLTGKSILIRELNSVFDLFRYKNHSWHYSEICYWMRKNDLIIPMEDDVVQYAGPYHFEMGGEWAKAAEAWKELKSPYEEALALMSGQNHHVKLALSILDRLGAKATYGKVRMELKKNGVKSIPRGSRNTTKRNPFQLTTRQIDVLSLLAEGLQNNEIADRLFVTSKTIEHHVSAVLSKLDVKSRSRAVVEGKRLGLIQ